MMRRIWNHLDKYRQSNAGHYSSRPGDRFGTFLIPKPEGNIRIIATDGDYKAAELEIEYAWEHVSVSLANRCPTWKEMDFVKDLFWNESECVMQLHVPKTEHKNHHPFCLHLWKPILTEIPRPPSGAVA